MMRRTILIALVAVARLAEAQCPPAGPSNWCSGTYQYDPSGNIEAIGADVYVYDELGRLVSGTADVQRTGTVSKQIYDYDAFGNRKSVSRTSGSVGCLGGSPCEISATANLLTNHLNTNSAQYDEAGNLTAIDNNAAYAYDAAGSLSRATVGADDRQFVYTADDERIAVRQGVSWTWTVRGLDQKVLREFTSVEAQAGSLPTSNRQWAKDYVWRDGRLLASAAPTSPGASTTVVWHYHLDHLGTPRVVSNSAGVLIGVHAYYPFGAELSLSPQEPATELMKFTGHERDLIAGDAHSLDYMHARYAAATLGRFLSVDPSIDLEKTIPEPQLWNRYLYVTNNPLRFVDSNGRERLQRYHFPRELGGLPEQTAVQAMESTFKLGLQTASILFAPTLWNGLRNAGGAIVSWALTNPNQATRVAEAVLSPPGSSGVSSPVPSEFFKEVSTTKGSIGILANATTKGTSLTLSNVAVYPMASGNLTNQVGNKEILGALKQLGGELKALGYTKLTIQGVRVSGANPGKVVDIVVDITKLGSGSN